jgi:O-antigen ligase
MIFSAAITFLSVAFFLFNPTLLVHLFVALSLWDEAMGTSVLGNISITRLVGIAILARWLLDHLGKYRKEFPALSRSTKLGFLYICVAGLSIFWSQYPEISRERFLTLFQLWVLIVVVPVYLLGTKKLNQMAITIALVSSLMAVVVFQNYLSGIGILDEQGLLRGMVIDSFDVNIAATTMLVGFAFSIGLAVFGEEKKIKAFGILASFLTLFGIVLTLSRSSIISAVLLILVFLFFMFRVYGLKLSHVLVMIVIIFGFTFGIIQTEFDNSLVTRMKTITNPVTINPRTEIWKVTYYTIRQSPIYGIGLGAFTSRFTYYQQFTPDLQRYWGSGRDAHSVYLGILAETGVIGFLAYLAFFASLLFDLKESRSKKLDAWQYQGVYISILLSTIALLINSFFLPLLFRKVLWLIPVFITALFLQTKNEVHSKDIKMVYDNRQIGQ